MTLHRNRSRRRLLRAIIGCRPDEHVWRKTYGDERLHRGAVYVCTLCPRKTDGPVTFYVDPIQARADQLAGRLRADTEITTCEVCGVTRNEPVNEHLAREHLNEMFQIDVDPRAGVSVIRAPRLPSP